MNVTLLKQKLDSKVLDDRLSGLREAIAESEALAVYVIKDYISREQDETMIAAMIITCARIGGEAEIDFIGSYLDSANAKIKKYAFDSLSLIDSPKTYPYILRLLTDPDPRFRQMAVKEVRHLGKKKSLEIIEMMIASEVDWHRKAALEVLEMLNNILYENELIDILSRAITASRSANCRDCLLKLKKVADAGSEYAIAAAEKLRGAAPDEIRQTVLEILGPALQAEKSAPDPTATAAAVAAESAKAAPPVEEKVISEFSSYVDSVVRTNKSYGPKLRKAPGADEDGASTAGSAAGRWLAAVYRYAFAKPFSFMARHRLKFGAVAVFMLACYLYLFPEIILGKGKYVELSSTAREGFERYLEKNGYKATKLQSGSISAYEHRFWASSLPMCESVFGKSVIFSAYEVKLQNTEIFEASVFFDKYGEVSKMSIPVNISDTDSADENDLIIMKNSFAYLSSAGGGMKILTIQEGDRSNKRQFLFKQAVDINRIENSALAMNLIRVETRQGTNRTNVSLNVDSGMIDPPDFPVEYIPTSEAEEPFLPRLVEKVRNLPFVGPEKIAKLEDIYYGTSDFMKRKFYGSTEEEEEAPAANVTVSRQSPAPLIALRTGFAEALEGATAKAAEISRSSMSDNVEKLKIVLAGTTELTFAGTIKSMKEANFAASSTATTAEASIAAATSEIAIASAATSESAIGAPADIVPIYKKSTMKDEGVWSTEEVPVLDGRNYVYKTKLRVDPKRPFAVMHMVSIDLSKVDIRLVPGTEEPISTIGLRGKGVIPSDPVTYQNLVCAFNGGFRTKHGKWGFISDGMTYIAPADGIATFAVDKNGKVRMGTWGSSIDTKETYMCLRQNLPPILENGKINSVNTYWGASVDNKTNVWRSAIGITRDGKRLIYGAGNSLTFDTLARGMNLAGCDYAMQMDINEYHTYFHLYRPNGLDKKGAIKLKISRLTDEMANETQRCIRPYTRDFFYLTWKNASPMQTAKN